MRKEKVKDLPIYKRSEHDRSNINDNDSHESLLVPTRRAKSPPPDLRPDFSKNPEALEDPATNPRKCFQAGRRNEQIYVQIAAHQVHMCQHSRRRGMLIGRAPGRFSNGKLEGRGAASVSSP